MGPIISVLSVLACPQLVAQYNLAVSKVETLLAQLDSIDVTLAGPDLVAFISAAKEYYSNLK